MPSIDAWKLVVRIGLAKKMRTFNKQSFHSVGEAIAGRVKHAQFWSKFDRLACNIAPAQDHFFEIDVSKKRIDVLGRAQNKERFLYVAGREYLMP